MYDILIQNGMIVDGTGCAGYYGDIAIQDDFIADIAPKITLPAKKIIDAKGLTVTPGFIDIHRHGDLSPLYHHGVREELRQGITTFINGNCGFSAFPSTPATFHLLQDYALPILNQIPHEFCGISFAQFTDALLHRGITSNMGFLVGAGTLRIAVKGFDPSPLTTEELHKLHALLASALEQGAMGLSMGLMYIAENYFTFEELCDISKWVAAHQKKIFVHMRGEGSSLMDSIDEVITLARMTGASFHISHLKAAGKKTGTSSFQKCLHAFLMPTQMDLHFLLMPIRMRLALQPCILCSRHGYKLAVLTP